jgi:hypothetical protein
LTYEIGFLIPYNVDKIENWKEKLEREVKKVDKIFDELDLPHVFNDSVEATSVAQKIKDRIGKTEIIIEISVEKRK